MLLAVGLHGGALSTETERDSYLVTLLIHCYTFTTRETERLGPVGSICSIFGIFHFQISVDILPDFLQSFNP